MVHVLDASRAVGVVGSLLNPQLKSAFVQKVAGEYEQLREHHRGELEKPLLSIQEARVKRTPIDWHGYTPPKPEFLGVRTLSSDGAHKGIKISLEEIAGFIDWSPFFHTWEIRGRYPAILENEKARELFEDAQELLKTIIANGSLTARGIYGFFPANAIEEDVELYTDEERHKVLTTFHFLRQQMAKPAGQFNHCLADFVAPKDTGVADYLGIFAVSAGFGTDELARKFERDNDDYNAIMTKALADRLAEAFAECLHKRVREEWGYGQSEHLKPEELIRERYQGIRPAAGYPACPDHTEKFLLWDLLQVEQRTGIKLTESAAMWPGASVSGLYFSHPESKYFGVGKLNLDQVQDYHVRKGMPLAELEKWLGPYLNYEPVKAGNGVVACGCGR